MEIFINILKAFLVGGAICIIGQLLINYTKLTPARILVIFLLSGVFLTAIGVYQYLVDFGGSGAVVPISGFGYLLCQGAIKGARAGILGALTGGIISAAAGISIAIIFSYLNALIFKPKTKY